MRSAVIGLSGGMDSATLLGHLINEGFTRIHCCWFSYGSKHNSYEFEAYLKLIDFYRLRGIELLSHTFDLTNTFKDFNSALLKSGEEIPEGHYEEESMSKTVVPGRNLIFASIMAGLAESVKAQVIALGVHSGDHAIYPDCRPQFMQALKVVIDASSDHSVSVIAPFLHDDKFSILKKGYSLIPRVPYEYTRTCYKDQELSCGKCGACQERLEAFEKICIADPIEYEK